MRERDNIAFGYQQPVQQLLMPLHRIDNITAQSQPPNIEQT